MQPKQTGMGRAASQPAYQVIIGPLHTGVLATFCLSFWQHCAVHPLVDRGFVSVLVHSYRHLES